LLRTLYLTSSARAAAKIGYRPNTDIDGIIAHLVAQHERELHKKKVAA
jgi:hypothetical protein